MTLHRTRATIVCTVLAFIAVATGRPAAAAPAPTPAPCGTENLVAGKLPSQQQNLVGSPALVTDGAAAPEGASWDAPAGIKLEGTSASLTYDLGKPTKVERHLPAGRRQRHLQDRGLARRKAGTFKQLVQAQNVVDHGHGMRTRAVRIRARDGPLPPRRRGGGRQRVFDLRVRGLLQGADAVSARVRSRRGADGGPAFAGRRCGRRGRGHAAASPIGPLEIVLAS